MLRSSGSIEVVKELLRSLDAVEASWGWGGGRCKVEGEEGVVDGYDVAVHVLDGWGEGPGAVFSQPLVCRAEVMKEREGGYLRRWTPRCGPEETA